MKKIIIMFAMVIYSQVLAQEAKEDNQRIAVYLHPISLIAGLDPDAPLFLYLTGEIPLSKNASLIIAPSLWNGGVDIFNFDDEEDDEFNIFRIGSGVGIRYFPNGNSDGLYLQAMPSFHYINVETTSKEYECSYGECVKTGEETETEKGLMADILGYLGYSFKYKNLSIFMDFGLGYVFVSDSNEMATGLMYDFNVAIGIPF